MKKIFILFAAAVAALSSCVEENALAPETKEGNVTIKAVSADSKTLLDGTDVVWENTDKIAVVLVDDQDVTTKEFSVKGEVNGANATFTGTIEPELEYTSAYAVYPASAVVDGVVSHTLPEVQTGVVTSGMNLSSALLDAEQLQAGEAVGTFHNALVLLQVVVPAGMQEISLTSDEYLVGPTDFYVTNGVLSRKTVLESATVTLKTGSELTAGTHSLLVYPVKGGLTINMKGTDGTEFTKFVNTPKFEASKYYTLDFTKVFNMQTTEVMAASPAGEELVVPIVSVNDYEYSVSVEGNPDWITYTLPTKGFHGEEIVFNVKKNDSGVERSADVTISWGDESTRTFTITQKALFMDFVEDAEGNSIQWEETFGVYASESNAINGTNAVKIHKNIFTIELSDDFSKGTYLVKNIFKSDGYYDNNGQPVSNKGGVYYADFVDGTLIIKMKNAVKSYGNMPDVNLNYDSVNKIFTATSQSIKADQTYPMYKAYFIGGYTAAIKVEEPAGPGADSGDAAKVLGNTYEESYSLSGAYGNTPGNLVFEESDDLSKGNVIIRNIFGCQATGMYATVSGNTITTVESAYIEYLQGNAPIGQLILTIGDNGNITIANQPLYNTFYLENYVATKQGQDPEQPSVTVDSIVGDNWSQDWSACDGLYKNNKVKLTRIDDTHVSISQMFDYVTIPSATFDPAAMTLTVPAGWSHPHGALGDGPEFVFSVSDDFNTLTLSGKYSFGGYMSVTDYVLTR